MHDLILHHYDTSPFSEKFRLILGAKQLSWKSVIAPIMLPKPDVVALTGGYRRTPFLQIGADIYCDTVLMCAVVDRLAPQPPLYPDAHKGLAEIVAQWADTALFWAAVPYTIQPAAIPHMFGNLPADFMRAFMADRAAMTGTMKRPTPEDARAQTLIYLTRLENLLSTSPFLLGTAPTIADFAAVQSLWFIRRAPPVAVILDGFPLLESWYHRMLAFGHGTREELSSAEALSIAAAAGGFAASSVEDTGFAAGEPVTVTPTDYAQDPVAGTLVGLTGEEVVVERTDPRAGVVHVHFPRVGFQITK